MKYCNDDYMITDMRTIGIIGEKGGTGKTTTVVGVAVEAAQAGQTVAVIDLDPQANASNWKDRRAANDLVVVSAQVSRLRQTLELARENGADIAIIDSPGKSDSAAIETASCADLVLIPSHARVFDLETLGNVRNLLRLAGDPAAFVVLNGLHPLATATAEQAKAMTEKLTGLRACPVHLSYLDIYGSAPASGKAPQEIDPHSKAAVELRQLYTFITQQLEILGEKEHGEEKPSRLAKGA
jgi:chromosome partitioning protein